MVGTVGTRRIYWVCAVPTFLNEVGTSCPLPSIAVQLPKEKPLHNFKQVQYQYGRGLRGSGKGQVGQLEALQPALHRCLALKNAARMGFTAAPQTRRGVAS
jgi:hypothetical protein